MEKNQTLQSITAMSDETIAVRSLSDIRDTLRDTFDFRVSGATSITGSAREGPLIGDFARQFGLALPDVDRSARVTAVAYDSGSGAIAVEARPASGMRTIVVSLPDGPPLLLKAPDGPPYALSNLPLIGDDLASAQSIQITSLAFASGSMSKAANDIVQALGTGLPRFSEDAGGTTISGTIAFGSNSIDFTLPPTNVGNFGGIVVSSTSDGTLWFAVQQTWGQSVVDKIAAKYDAGSGIVNFAIDASISVDVLKLELQGLGINIDTSTWNATYVLEGAGVSFSKPPLNLSGALLNTAPLSPSSVNLAGDVSIATGGATVQLLGDYSTEPKPASAFLYADLATKFGGPPSFSVTSIAAGGGYNSALTVPATVDLVSQFPFLQVLANPKYLSSDPLQALDAMMKPTQWVSGSQGSWWFAAGLNATSFQYVNTSALIVVEDASELVLSLLGKSVAQFPQGTLQTLIGTLAYVELDLLASFAPSAGVFSAQAQVAPSSFILSKDCVLSGGFAFFDWFGSNQNAPDFVLSLGGYNPAFTPPPYYPVVPRIGFLWSIDSSISIGGDCYFAMTPAAMMAGGALEATYQSGSLKAWFDAHADMMLAWAPFQFQADVGINVGASYTLDVLGITGTVTVELGCDLELWGPPTGGTVTVDWSIISFTIPFGEPQPGAPNGAQWSDVVAMLPPNPVAITPVSGTTPTGTSSAAGDPWVVRGSQFAFNTSSAIPATSTVPATQTSAAIPSSFSISPMGVSNVTATHALTIKSNGADATSYFDIAPLTAKTPTSLWGTPPSNPTQPPVPNGNAQLTNPLYSGLQVTAKPPVRGPATRPALLSVFTLGTNPNGNAPFPAVSASEPAPALSDTTVSTIAATVAGNARRNQIFATLGSAQPITSNDAMTNYRAAAGHLFAAEPMLINQTGAAS